MKNRHSTAGGMHLLRAVSGCFQTSGRCSWRGEGGSAFEDNMKARMNAEAYYAVPMARI